jgi:hypothetical protein
MTEAVVLRELNRINIGMRQHDGYIHATTMCKAASKEWSNYWQNKTGSWPDLVNRGGLGVCHHFLVQRRGGKTASFLWGNFSMSHSEVLMLPTSPNVAKSRMPLS